MSGEVNKDLLAERREARRRRILENMDSRLNKISYSHDGPETYKFPPPVKNLESSNTDAIFTSPQISSSFHDHAETDTRDQHQKLDDDLKDLSSQETSSETLSSIEVVLIPKLRLLVLFVVSVLSFILVKFNMGYMASNNILLPFLAIEVICICAKLTSSGKNSPSILSSILALCGIKSRVVVLGATVFLFLYDIIHDISVYLFVYVVCAHVTKEFL